MRLDGKVALVSGASRGIGRAIAMRLGRDGGAGVVNYSGNHEAAHETVAAIEASSGRAVAVQGDVGKVGYDARWITGQNIRANGGII